MDERILVTGFRPFAKAPSTLFWGNPSEKLALSLGEMHGSRVRVEILPVDERALTQIANLVEAGPRGILMLGTDLQTSQCILELSGVDKAGQVRKSAFAHSVQQECKALGMATHSTSRLGILDDGYCMRSYERALKAAKDSAACAFVHVQSPPLANIAKQLEQVSGLFNLIAAAAWPRQGT